MSGPVSSVVGAEAGRIAESVQFADGRGIESIIGAHLGLVAGGSMTFGQAPIDEDLAALLKELQGLYGTAIKAVLLYGSYTRGARDSLVDLYVLLDGYPGVIPRWQVLANKLLPPNVYQLQAETGVRCKYALLPLRQFVRRLDRDFHSYFWARFAQPCQVVYVSDSVSARTLLTGLGAAVRRFLGESALGATQAPTALGLWTQGLALTYGCELRAESGMRADELVAANSDYFAALGDAWIDEQNLSDQQPGSAARTSSLASLLAPVRWPARKVWGKVLSVLRLVKAAFTFNDGFDYLLWKIERHSGIYIEPTPLQRKVPLLFAWPLFWRLRRLGAFR